MWGFTVPRLSQSHFFLLDIPFAWPAYQKVCENQAFGGSSHRQKPDFRILTPPDFWDTCPAFLAGYLSRDLCGRVGGAS